MKHWEIPNTENLLLSTAKSGDKLLQIIRDANSVDNDGRYLHWEEMKYKPSPKSLTKEEFWLRTKLARKIQMKNLPFLDKEDKPFVFSDIAELREYLRIIDRFLLDDYFLRSSGTHFKIIRHRDLQRKYSIRSFIEEAIHSSQMEGATTTRRVAKEMLTSNRDPVNKHERMIWNNYRAIRFVEEQVREERWNLRRRNNLLDTGITIDGILELHRIVTDGTLANPEYCGKLRESDDIIVSDRSGERTLHVPPKAVTLEERLQRICDFANANLEEKPYIHPVVRAILLHFMVGYDHPFEDGNGRTARSLFYWAMARYGYTWTENLSISRIIKNAHAQYRDAFLYTETDENDTSYFIFHQLGVLMKAYEAFNDYIEQMEAELEQFLSDIEETHLRGRFNERQISLLRQAMKRSKYSYDIRFHQREHDISYQTARKDLIELEKLGLLVRSKVGRRLRYFVPDDLHEKLQTQSDNWGNTKIDTN